MRIVDLSQDIYQGMHVYPGHTQTELFQHATHQETAARFKGGFSFQTSDVLMNDNGPTHVDAFSHLDPDPRALTIDHMPLTLFFGPAVCLDVSHVAPRTDIRAADLEAAEAAGGVAVEVGDIVLLHTGASERHRGSARYLVDFPGLGESASAWIAAHGVKTFGVDSPTPDNPASRTYPCHMMSRAHSITHYENLANLDQLVGRRFTFAGFPLKLRGGHGGPTRAVALIEEETT
jgi:kynurenine formamidase